MSTTKKAFISLCVLLLIFVGYVGYTEYSPESRRNVNDTPVQPIDAIDDTSLPFISRIEYALLDHFSVGVSLDIPRSAEVLEPQDDVVQITFLGPDAHEDSEINDGFVMTVRHIAIDPNDSREAVARRESARDIDNASSTVVLSDVTLNDKEAFIYKHNTELGNQVVTYIFKPFEQHAYKVTILVQDPEGRGYQSVISRMLQWMTFAPPRAPGASERDENNLIQVEEPHADEVVRSPVSYSGEARGVWFFEGDFPVVVTDWDGRIVGEGYATAEGEWMTEEFVPFSGSTTITLPEDLVYASGTVIFRKANPSGLPENDDAVEVPILFELSE